MKASSSKVMKVEEDSESSDEDSSKEEEMGLFIKRYNQNIKKHKFKHSDKNLINLMKSHPQKREGKKKEENVTCNECENLGYYRATCLILSNCNKKKDKDSYKTKGRHAKKHMDYIPREEEAGIYSSSFNSRSDDEFSNLCLMAHKKDKDSMVSNYDSNFKLSYNQLSKLLYIWMKTL